MKRGLALADAATRQRVAKQGGIVAHSLGHAHRLTREERQRGGKNSPSNFLYRPTLEVQAIGRRGGQAAHAQHRYLAGA